MIQGSKHRVSICEYTAKIPIVVVQKGIITLAGEGTCLITAMVSSVGLVLDRWSSCWLQLVERKALLADDNRLRAVFIVVWISLWFLSSCSSSLPRLLGCPHELSWGHSKIVEDFEILGSHLLPTEQGRYLRLHRHRPVCRLYHIRAVSSTHKERHMLIMQILSSLKDNEAEWMY